MKNTLRKTLFVMSSLFTISFISTLCSGMLLAANTMGQSIRDVKITVDFNETPLSEVFDYIASETNFDFALNPSIEKREDKVTLMAEDETVATVLEEVGKQARLSFRQNGKTILVKAAKRKPKGPPPEQKTKPQQDRSIQGKVTDDSGNSLPGASILIQGTNIGTIADAEGNFRMIIPQTLVDSGQELVLEISFIGFETQQIPIGDRTIIDVSMVVSSTALEGVEVVSTGYYDIEQRLNPGNIVKLDAQTIESQPVSNPLQTLQGRLTGVSITQRSGVPGSNFDIQIRGLNSVREEGNDPLYLINGVPYPSQSLSTTGAQLNSGGINPLNFINPNDIESIEILKDADATAIYGSRGANGVVRITTKKGKADKLRVIYSGSVGIGSLENKLDLLNTEQYLEMRNEAFANDGRDPRDTDFDVNGEWSQERDTDWQEELLGGNSNFTNHQLTFSGGSGSTTFLFGLNYLKETTIFSDDFADMKTSGNLNLNYGSPDRRFNLNFLGNFAINNNELFFANLASQAVTLAPNAPALYNEDGSLNWENGTFNNPMSEFLRKSNTRTVNWVTNLNLSYKILNGLTVKSSFGYTELRSDEVFIRPIAAVNPFQVGEIDGRSSFGNSSVNTWIIEPQIEYLKAFNKHEITFLVGSTFQETNTDRQQINARGYDSDALLRNPLAAEIVEIGAVDNSEYRFNSAYARLNYMYDEKYIVNLTGRRDGSSRFGPGRQFADFGAIGVAWIFSDEDFISDNLGFLSTGKLRGSYGVTGSDQIGNYQFLELWNPTDFGYEGVQGLAPNNLLNENFAWEETTKGEIGLELGFFRDRIQLGTSYFKNSSSNQLIGQPLPGTAGFGTVQTNFPAEVENRGWEVELNSINLSKGNFKWSTSFNISILRNELVSFDNIDGTSFANIYAVGEPLSVVYLFDFTGIDPETGLGTFRNVDGSDRLTLDDRLPLGNREQDFFGGLQNTLSYKGFTLDFLFRFVKQEGFDYLQDFVVPGEFSNQPIYVLERWQSPGDITGVGKFTQTGLGRAANRNLNASDQIITDASFIRLQNMSLSYDLPTSLIQKYRLEAVSIILRGQNLLTLTGYRGWDPETQSLSLPPLRTITAGITLTL